MLGWLGSAHSKQTCWRKGSHPSWAWSNILQGRDLVQLRARWNVGNGQDILIYQDKWVPTLSGFKELSLDHQDLLESPSRPQPPAQLYKSSWSRPPCGIIKVNVDASFSPNSGVAALTMVGRNSNGKISFRRAWRYLTSTPLSAKAATLLKAVRFAEDKGFQDIIFESDNQVLISSIQQSSKPLPWEAQSLIMSIRQSCISNPGFKFNFVPRSGNQVADWVARASLSGQCPLYWAHCPPNILRNLLCRDVHKP
ncbi:hypothetical protein SLEP1_g56051 [Rubroshorea leprosula]|uniref:RNase H type-1 domain-containing protein n=1 Tax=Rubroshorea leprosula TaxID=152421 RepID=A0AAV5MID8_9ROSI|nr:hypothetical protein SLEP1_g56051 [Rubroshorea leprosula]